MTVKEWGRGVYMSGLSSVITLIAVMPLAMVAVLFMVQMFWRLFGEPVKLLMRLPVRRKL